MSQPWHAAFPSPRTTAASIPRDQLLQWMQQGRVPGKDYVVIDLRRADHEGGTIKHSLNLPAQTLYPSLPTLYEMLAAAGVKHVLWFCGSSAGRGTRAANWFADLLEDRQDNSMQSLVLTGGIKGWVAAGEDYRACMEGLDERVWVESGVLAGTQ
ncbi:putative arsenate reductase [Aspergillus taichungensis]|uniref:Putative arsenate reductase n=1 Tax=Aspergillus taichungensis TaxID=482145 RepID=A0A2J5HGU6_9EURO|nr:putative arsenate reductase [Aspergillus taichungensis]